jgi:putative DNA primase/helicase
MPNYNGTNGHEAQLNGALQSKVIALPGIQDVRLEQIVEAPPASPAPKKRRSLKLSRLSDVQPEPVRWLWPDRIARKVVLFTGLPDCGKTTAAIDIAARVTRGAEWPDCSGTAPLGSVIFLTAEDGIADTIRTRAGAAGADLRQMYFLDVMRDEQGRESSFDLGQDLVLLAEHVKAIGDVALIVIDPITAYMGAGKIDTHKTADVRAVLSPLKDFADEHGVAVVGLTHPSKSVTKAMNAATGSQGFVAAARAAWLFSRETDEEGQETGRTLMLSIKNNLSGRRNNGMAYRIEAAELGEGMTAPRIVWDHEPVTVSADAALAASMEPSGGGAGDGGALGEAIRFIEEEFLVAERIEAVELATWAKNAGISAETLKRARKKLGVEAKRDGFGQGAKYYLCLPSRTMEGQD